MRTPLFIITLLLNAFFVHAQPGKYAAMLIPDSLAKNADAVVREEAETFKVKDVNSASLQVHRVVTIMNPDGKNELLFRESTSKFLILEDAEIIVYNALGVKLNSYTKKEMQMFGYGEGLVEDGKTYWFDVTAASYPITVETNYHLKFRGTLGYPAYDIQRPYQSVQQSGFNVEIPASLGLRYQCLNNAPKPQITEKEGIINYSWSVSGLITRKMERQCGSYRNYLPYVQLAPNHFQMDDYAGDMGSWKQLGLWYANLIGNTNVLSETRKAFFINLVKDASTSQQKAAIIYQYLQQNMRYVSIQLGIGGWKPFSASFVDEKKYGDCKALSNYMQAALSAVGVKSYSTIIHWDQRIGERMKNPLSENFPISSFNHVVVCIPQPKDSIWLECTSTTAAFGELGSGKQNRTALMITENGGILVHTPASKAQQNMQTCRTDIQLNEDGTGKVMAMMNATGDIREEQLYFIGQATNDEKMKYLVNGMDWKHPDALHLTSGNKTAPAFHVTADMQYEKIPSLKTSNKMFLPVRLYPLLDEEIPENTKRSQDYYFSFPYQNTDTTIYHLPAGFTIDYQPANKSLSYPFGQYNSQFSWDAATNTLTIIARLEISQAMVKAADYQELSRFGSAVTNDVNEKLVIKRL